MEDEEVAGELNLPRPDVARLKFVVMVARFERRKRHSEFLEAFANVSAAIPNAHLVLLGEGPDHEHIRRRVKELSLSSRVHIIGFREDPERWIKRANVCVLASEREGLPRVIVQYALCARPIVCTELPGVEAIVRQGLGGYLVPLDAVGAMEEPLIRLLSDEELEAQQASWLAALDLSAWSVDRMVGQLDQIYKDVLARRTERQLGASPEVYIGR
jgi:glycosyltransferase involved in cell wall biosynthesis